MSDSTTSDSKYSSWQDAALGGNLLSYAWEHRPSIGQLVPGYSPDEPWWQKVPDIGSIPARMALGPLMQGGEAMRRWMEGDQGPETKQLLTSSVLGLETGGLARSTPGPASFGAWHGSRHLFEPEPGAPMGAFKDEKIGSGEGAQAYGWGHYVAGRKETGESYQTAGGDDFGVTKLDGKEVKATDFMENQPHIWHALHELGFHDGDVEAAKNFLIEHSNYLNKEGWLADNVKEQKDYFNGAKEHLAAAQWLEDNAKRIEFEPSEGHLYQIHVKPDEHELLDWDKPFNKQSPQVQQNIMKLSDKANWPPDTSGRAIYKSLGQILHDDAKKQLDPRVWEEGVGRDRLASEALHDAGIPGLKYRDQQSRNLPEDHPDITHNYVLFHPQHIHIIGRDGVHHTVEPVDHDPFTEGK